MLPNLLTLARLALAPFVAWLIATGHARAGLYLLVAAGLTDAADGVVARRFGWTSASGAYLDPLADKVLAGCVFVALGIAGALPWWLVAVVFGRDILILAAAGVFLAFSRVREFAPSVWGRISTFCQVTTAGFAIGNLAYPELGVGWIVNALVWVAAAATVWSGAHYSWRTFGAFSRFSPLPLLAAVLSLAAASAAGAQPKIGEWQSLFDGKSLQGWRETPFTGRGRVSVEKGTIRLGPGGPMTGVTWTGSFPRSNYEVRLEAARLEGNDFFASLTFPVKDSYCTWVTGGWGGDIVGLSSLDDWDASENETRSYFNFDNGRWYALRLRVTDDRITAWIDEGPIINVVITGRSIDLRFGEIKLSAPLGFASYATAGGLRKIEYRLLPPAAANP